MTARTVLFGTMVFIVGVVVGTAQAVVALDLPEVEQAFGINQHQKLISPIPETTPTPIETVTPTATPSATPKPTPRIYYYQPATSSGTLK